MIKNNSKVIGEYKSVILNLEKKKIKGRLFITKDGISFEVSKSVTIAGFGIYCFK